MALNEGGVEQGIAMALESELVKAAEPLIQKALADIETALRAKVVQSCHVIMTRSFEIFREQQTLHIKVDLGKLGP